MSADLSLLPGSTSAVSTSAVAPLALNGASASAAVTADTGDTGPFAALFQQLLGKQVNPGVDPALLDPTLPIPSTTEGKIGTQLEEATENLDTLLPFLEAIGLAQMPSTTTSTQEASPALTQADSAPVVLTAAVVPQVTNQPAISAVPTMSVSTDDPKQANSAPAMQAVGLTQAAPTTTSSEEDSLPLAQSDSASALLAATVAPLVTNQPAISAAPIMSDSSGDPKQANSAPVMQAVGAAQTAPATTATATATATTTEEDSPPLTDTDITPVVVLAAAVTPQVTHQPATSIVPTVSASGDINKPGNSAPVTEGMLAEASIKPVKPDGGQQSGTMSEDRNFGSQLNAAIEGNREPSQNPATTAGSTHPVAFNTAYREALATAPQLPIAQAVGSANWNDAVGNQIVWMANHQESHAELVLNPPQMGRVEVSLSVSGEQATASFVSSNPAVREALEAALPRLREVLADAGIQLGQAQVGAENTRQSGQQEKNANNFDQNRATQPENKGFMTATQTLPAATGLKLGRGLVDVFA